MKIDYRLIKESEYPFLKDMLYEALFVPPGKKKFPKSILENSEIKKYIENWNQLEFDLAILAFNGAIPVGAIWGRLFPPDKKGLWICR